MRLSSLGEIIGGGTPSTSIPAYWDGGIPWITPADMRNNQGKYISRGSKDISELGVAKSSTRILPAGSVVFSSRAPIGYVAITENELYTNQGFKSVSFFTEGHQDFIYHALIGLTESIKQRASGTTFAEISGSEFGKTLIPLPPKRESSRIVKEIESYYSVLEKIQDSRARYKRILSETPTSLRQQLIQAAIQGQLVPQNPNDEPASILLERIAQERTAKLGKKATKTMSRIERRGSKTHSTYHEIFSDGSEKEISEELPFSIPDNWQWTRLGTIADVKGGKRIPSGMHTTSDKTAHVYIRVADMVKGSISDKNLAYISDDVYKKISRYTISKDDLYLTIAGTIGKAGIVPDIFDGMNLTENAVKITNFSINKQFLLFLLISECCRSQFTAKTTCVAQPKLAIERILTTLLPIPPLCEQEKICNTLHKCLGLVDRS